ncbi:MAG TPA: glutathione S-transferase family protein [Kofleriaceae bacterium]|jgi:glutathione S-transferase|nr:glutathione S-transferase family protein [Kofleriaceae bacterium]
MDRPKLYGTPLSHFARKIRILLHEFGVPFDFIRTPSLLEASTPSYGANPLMRIPTFIHGDTTVIESDHIARYIVERYDPADRLSVCAPSVTAMNRLAVVNGVMGHDVTLVLARRGGLEDLNSVVYFRKLFHSIASGLAWLDREIDPEADGFDYVDIATLCMWDHLTHYKLVPGLDEYRRIAARAAHLADRDSVARTAPAASLAAAAADAAATTAASPPAAR